MKLLDLAVEIARGAGRLAVAMKKEGLEVMEKGRNDLVTNVDKAVEDYIVKEVKAYFPAHQVLGEEASFGSKGALSLGIKEGGYLWIIDPIDGTTNFTHGLPHYAVSIAVFKTFSAQNSANFTYLGGELVVGVVYAPELKEMFFAEKGGGAFLNRRRIEVSSTDKLKNSLLVTGFPPQKREINLPYFLGMLDKCQAVRRFGAASLDLCYTAAGRFDGYWEFGLQPWDVAAGALIIQEAGGLVTDTYGNMLDLFGQNILAATPKIHKQMLNAFKLMK